MTAAAKSDGAAKHCCHKIFLNRPHDHSLQMVRVVGRFRRLFLKLTRQRLAAAFTSMARLKNFPRRDRNCAANEAARRMDCGHPVATNLYTEVMGAGATSSASEGSYRVRQPWFFAARSALASKGSPAIISFRALRTGAGMSVPAVENATGN